MSMHTEIAQHRRLIALEPRPNPKGTASIRSYLFILGSLLVCCWPGRFLAALLSEKLIDKYSEDQNDSGDHQPPIVANSREDQSIL